MKNNNKNTHSPEKTMCCSSNYNYNTIPIDEDTYKKMELKDMLYLNYNTLYKILLRDSAKYNREHLEYCYNLLKNKPYITTQDIVNDPLLGIAYGSFRDYQKKLFDTLLKTFPDLKEIRGKYNKRCIFKTGNESAVKHLIRLEKRQGKTTTKKTLYEDIKNHILNLPQEFILTDKLRKIIQDEFEVKQSKRLRDILKRLKRDGVILPNYINTGFEIIRG